MEEFLVNVGEIIFDLWAIQARIYIIAIIGILNLSVLYLK